MTVRAKEVVIHPADPARDREAILDVLRRNLPRAVQPGRHDWLYLSNPRGPALVWLARTTGGDVVGTSAAHLRRLRVPAGEVDALNLGDFAIDPDYRTLGPALQLLRATLAPVREGRFAVSYDHPNERLLPVYTRVGGTSLSTMTRLVRPVRATPYVKRRWRNAAGAALAGFAGDVALRVRDAFLRSGRGIEVEEQGGSFGDEYTELDCRLNRRCPIVGVRDAAYLEWRFRRHPIWAHVTLVARMGGRVAGYAVVRRGSDRNLEVVELQAPPDTGVTAALLAEIVRRVRADGGESVTAQALARSPAERLLLALGFRPRGAGTAAVVVAPEGSPIRDLAVDPASWWMIEGDRDV